MPWSPHQGLFAFESDAVLADALRREAALVQTALGHHLVGHHLGGGVPYDRCNAGWPDWIVCLDSLPAGLTVQAAACAEEARREGRSRTSRTSCRDRALPACSLPSCANAMIAVAMLQCARGHDLRNERLFYEYFTPILLHSAKRSFRPTGERVPSERSLA